MTMDDDDDDDDLTPEEEEAWCAERRAQAVEYLRDQGVQHGEVGEWPAFHMAPFVSIWVVESLRASGAVGWWVICGDLPSDYCSSADGCTNPRRAMRRFAEQWLTELATTSEGAPTIGETGLPADFADLLRGRAEFLLQMVADDEIWPQDAPDSDSSRKLH